jgi:hypothetical protein
MTMKSPLILSIIVIFIISLGLSGTVSQAGEIDDLKKRLLFLESQKEIVKKLDGMQSNIDGLRGKVDGFQKELDDFRVQYDLKASTKETKTEAKQPQELKITAQQYVDATLGNTQFGAANGKRFKYYLKKGGRMVLNMENGYYDEGTFEIKDGKICLQWKKVNRGVAYCLRDYEMDGDLITNFSERTGKRGGPFRIAKGIAGGFQDVKK